ncbi:MAG: acyl-CoA dehydrogenase family protein [Gammaproteobacteria bacterium]|nr:acyl-CoA dehydrogenase family protein [Gammaproteobacteria bacterium]
MAEKSYLQWPFLDDSHRQLKAELETWCQAHHAELEDHSGGTDAACKRLVKLLGKAGWLKHCVIAPYGGVNEKLDVRSISLLRETLAYYSGLADFALAMQGLGSGALSLFASDSIKKEFLTKVATGEKIAAFALTEEEAGSDVAALKTTAIKDGDDYIINGGKVWISNGGIADYYTVFVRTGEGPGAKGLSVFVVDANTQGLEIEERIEVIAPHPLARLKFTNMRVPATRMLGKPGQGFKIAMATLDIFRGTVGAAALGFARRALDEALGRVTKRILFGAPLSEMQITQSKLAEMALDIDVSALLVYRSAWTKDCVQERVTREAAMAKLYATDHAQETIDKALQMFGGLGVKVGSVVEELYREIRALRIYEGASEVQKIIIARAVLSDFAGE